MARQFGPPQAMRPAFHGQTPPQSRIAAAIGGAAAAAPLPAHAGPTTLAGLSFGPPIIAMLASALQSDHAAWQIGQRHLADLAEYVRLRWLKRNPHPSRKGKGRTGDAARRAGRAQGTRAMASGREAAAGRSQEGSDQR